MESLLIAVTVISLVLAVTMSVVAWTLLKAERQRAAARLEALEALAFSGDADRQEPVAEPVRVPAAVAPMAQVSALKVDAPGDAHGVHVVAPAIDDEIADFAPELPDWDAVIRGHASEPEVRLADARAHGRNRAVLPDAMFGTEPASNAGTRRLLAVAALGLLIAAGYATAAALRSPEVVAALAASTPPPSRSTEPQPLELLSLKHMPDANGAFAVSGFVQNPPGGKNLTNVEVVVYLFDYKDQYFMTGRSALETADMRAGTESTFDVHVPGATNVGRYRVGFRQADGTVVAHVDRRGQFPEGTSETIGADHVRPAGGMR